MNAFRLARCFILRCEAFQGGRVETSVINFRFGVYRNAEQISVSCSIPDEHIGRRRSGRFMARSMLRDIQTGDANVCSTLKPSDNDTKDTSSHSGE